MAKIAQNYVFEGDFKVDFLSTVDVIGIASGIFGYTVGSSLQSIQDLLRLLKVYRIRKLLQKIREVN